MCAICSAWEKEKMTANEAFRAISETLMNNKDKEKTKHLQALSERIIQKEVPDPVIDEALEETWQNELLSEE